MCFGRFDSDVTRADFPFKREESIGVYVQERRMGRGGEREGKWFVD